MSEFTDAIKAGDVARLSALLEIDPALPQSQEEGVTPLLLSIYYGKSDVARLLVERGAPVSFAEACALGDRDRMLRLLDEDPSALHVRSADGYPPLGLAIFFRHPDIARLLIERGADVHAAAENAQRVAPVHAAAAVCDHATLRLWQAMHLHRERVMGTRSSWSGWKRDDAAARDPGTILGRRKCAPPIRATAARATAQTRSRSSPECSSRSSPDASSAGS